MPIILGDRMIKQLLNSVIAKYYDLSVSCRSIIIGLSLQLWQIIDLLATDKSQYFAQPRPIIVKYFTHNVGQVHSHTMHLKLATKVNKLLVWTIKNRC